MKIGYKIAIGTAVGIGVGVLGYKIILNKRKNDANKRATPDVQKDLLISQVLIALKKEDTEANRRLYTNMTIEELQAIIDNNTQDVAPLYTYSDYTIGEYESQY